MRRLRTLALATVASLPLGGCAGSTAPTGYSASVAAQLQHDVLVVSRAASAKDVPAATAALIGLRRHLDAAQRAGTVSRAKAAGIEAAATRVTADLDALAAASAAHPTPTPTATATATPSPAHWSAPAPARRSGRVTVIRPPERHQHHGDGGEHGGGKHGDGGHGGGEHGGGHGGH